MPEADDPKAENETVAQCMARLACEREEAVRLVNAAWPTMKQAQDDDWLAEYQAFMSAVGTPQYTNATPQYTKEEFVAALTEVWTDLPVLLGQMTLPLVCHRLAADAFMERRPDSDTMAMLREQLRFLDQKGHFVFSKQA